jgi:hypothetical protein
MKLLSERLAYVYAHRPNLEGERGQIGLSVASGASKSVVNQWLADKIKSLDIRYALRLEAETGFSHIWLMTGEGEPQVSDSARHAVLVERDNSAEIVRLVTIYSRANKARREDIMRMAEVIDRMDSTAANTADNQL